ncbi:TPM domain-containing protein [Kocuria gwangalliensis]|uniref:TPM domain-containing protein n=1 Tax=Kocuria gwangalliensis TaxID=501592 RepID=A0ABP8XAZ8_9MICC
MSRASSIRRTIATAGACIALAVSAQPAFAEPPATVDPGTRIVDSANALSNESQVQEGIDQVASEHNVTLYVVMVDQFTDPSNPSDWIQEFAEANGFGSNDAVLAVATDSRQARMYAGNSGPLSQSQVQDIYTNNVVPALRNSDWDGAAMGAVEGINSELGGVSIDGAGGVVGSVVVLGGIAAAGVGAVALMGKRRRGRNQSRQGNVPAGRRNAPPQRSLVPLPELHKRAGASLVEADNAIQHSEQELQFAQLQYGTEQTKPFETALAQAKEHMRASFELQKKLEDHIPDTEADQRAWLGEIIDRTQKARAPLAEQERSFADLRQLETRAPEALQSVETELRNTQPRLSEAENLLVSLAAHYDDAALAPVRDNGEQARDRLEFAGTAIAEAHTALEANNLSEAVLGIRAAEEAVGQAQGLVTSVEHAQRDLNRAEESLKDAVSIAQRDVAEAEGLVEQGSRPELAGAAAGVRSVLRTVTQNMASGRYDPVGSTRRLAEAKDELDKGLAAVRSQNDQARSARETLAHTLVSAQASLSTAGEYIWARRGGVGSEARTQLSEAERHFDVAQQLQNSDPVRALNEANQAIRLADGAQRAAQSDVDQFSYPGGYGGYGGMGRRSNGMGGAMLGGILLGGILGGGGGGGGFGGGGMGGGGFGGGFGGGGGGGFDIGGNF